MKRKKYDEQIECILKNLRQELFEIVKKYGEINLYELHKYRLVVGSYNEAVADKLYIVDDKLMLTCCYWVKYDVILDGDFERHNTNIGSISYNDQLNIYRLVCDIINDKKNNK